MPKDRLTGSWSLRKPKDDTFEQIRKRNILDQAQSQVPEEPTPTFQSGVEADILSPDQPEITDRYNIRGIYPDMMKAVRETYTPSFTDRDNMRTLLDNQPERQTPGWGRALIASGMSLKSQDPIGTTDKVLNAPYIRDMTDWKEKVGPRHQLAQLENQTNAQERSLATTVATATVGLDRNLRTQEYQDTRNEIARIRAEANKAKIEGANVTIDKNSGQIIATYEAGPKKGSYEILGKVPGYTNVHELADIQGKYNVDAAAARAGGELARTNQQGWTTYFYSDGTKVRSNERTGEKEIYPPGSEIPADKDTKVPETVPNKLGPSSRTGAGTGRTVPTKEREASAQAKFEEILKTDPIGRQYIDPKSKVGARTMIQRPVAGQKKGYWSNDTWTDQDVQFYDETRAEAYPDYKPPTRTQPASQGELKKAPPSSQQEGFKLPSTPGPSIMDQRRQMGKDAGKTPAKSPSVPAMPWANNPSVSQSQRRMGAAPMPQTSSDADALAAQDALVKKSIVGELPDFAVVRRDKRTGKYEVSLDGEKTWQPYTPGTGGR